MIDQNINPLNVDLSSVDTSRPLLAGGKMTLKVEKAELVSGTKNPNARMLSLELSTTDSQPGIDGQPLNVGIRVFHKENFVPVGKLSNAQIVEGMGKIVQSAAMPSGTNLGNIDSWYKQLEGKLLKTRVIVEPAQGSYGPRNSVAEFLKA